MTQRKLNKLRSEMTDQERKQYGGPNISKLFRVFNSNLNEIWDDYISINFYLRKIHEGVKSGDVVPVSILKLVLKPRLQPADRKVIYGIIQRIGKKTSGIHAFIDAVTLFEHFMSKLVLTVYMDFPNKLRGLNKDPVEEADTRRKKLLDVILESADRDEMIAKLIEEKIRGFFYGNPSDLFEKDKANIGFKTHFKENQRSLVGAFQEITARRNIIMHNDGRVDQKYLSEVPGSALKLGDASFIDEVYLKEALLAIKELAASSAQLVATNIYKSPAKGKVDKVQKAAGRRRVAENRAGGN